MGGMFAAIDAITQGLSFSQTVQYALSGAVTGAIAGFVADVSVATAGLGTAVLYSALASGAANFGHSIITDKIQNPTEKANLGKAAANGIVGAAMGAYGTLATAPVAPFVKSVKSSITYAWNTVKVEASAVLTKTLPKIVNQLADDTLVAGVTSFGSWLFGKLFA